MGFLPAFFGEEHMMNGEGLVFCWLRNLSEDYNGGLWNYYTLSNGGFYMAPATEKTLSRACLPVTGLKASCLLMPLASLPPFTPSASWPIEPAQIA